MDDLMNLVGIDRLQQLGYLGHVTAIQFDAVQVGCQVGPRRSQVKADYLLAPIQKHANNSVADKAGAAGDHYRHDVSPEQIIFDQRTPCHGNCLLTDG